MDSILIFKSDVLDFNTFVALLRLYDCEIASIEEEYYIITGTMDNIDDFRKYWSEIGDLDE